MFQKSAASRRQTASDRAGTEKKKKAGERGKEDLNAIVAEIPCLETPKSSHKKVFLLQFPNKKPGEQYNSENYQKPLELRIKPNCGLIEVDVPVLVHEYFNKVKGLQYGEALRKSPLTNKRASHRPAGGVGIGAPTSSSRADSGAPAHTDLSAEALPEDFEDAVDKGLVMDKITLAGQFTPHQEGYPIYHLGTFANGVMHLTRVDGIVQLRPQLYHIDAFNEQGKSASKGQRDMENQERDDKEDEARAVNISVKSADTEDLEMSDVAKTLKAIQEEEWHRMPWRDDDDWRSWEVYSKHLVHPDTANAIEYECSWTAAQYLDAISCPRIDPTKSQVKGSIVTPRDESETEYSDSSEDDSDTEEDSSEEGDEEGSEVGPRNDKNASSDEEVSDYEVASNHEAANDKGSHRR